MTRMTNPKKLWIGIGVLILLSPLGIIIPKLFNANGAWGEWGVDEIEKAVGFVPAGMKRLAEKWKAPLPDYGLPGQGQATASQSIGYIVTAIIGVALIVGIMYALTWVLTRRKDK
jgi:cobalt/nickel transport protein